MCVWGGCWKRGSEAPEDLSLGPGIPTGRITTACNSSSMTPLISGRCVSAHPDTFKSK